MGYLCANFSLPKPLCSRVTPDVRDKRQTDSRQTKASLNASALWGAGIGLIKEHDVVHLLGRPVYSYHYRTLYIILMIFGV